MIKEREELVRSEYDKVLTSKLAGLLVLCDSICQIYHVVYSTEQYDTFVKFSHDQVEKRLAESAFSCKSNLTSFVCLFTPSSTQ